MKHRLYGILGLLLLIPLVLLAGYATESSYQGSETRYYSARGYYRAYEPEYSSPGEVPPYYYGDNPGYEHWFSAPYWMPDVGP
jgi:hypothetical protein